MAGKLVFVTGANGFVGAHVVNEALRAGYRVRGTVRRQENVDRLKDYFHKRYPVENAEFVIIEDITDTNSFEKVLSGVDYIHHVASPLASTQTSTDWNRIMFEPAKSGTVAILNAALKVPTIKQVVVTSSVMALMEMTDKSLIPENGTLKSNPSIDDEYANHEAAYHASKIMAAKAQTQFIAEKNPKFRILSVNPVYIFGEDLLQTNPDSIHGTNRTLWRVIHSETPGDVLNAGVHVLDVADAHMKAMTIDAPTDTKFLLSDQPFKWSDLVTFVKQKYPEIAEDVKLRPDSDNPLKEVPVQNAPSILGMKFRPLEEYVGDVVHKQLALIKASKQ